MRVINFLLAYALFIALIPFLLTTKLFVYIRDLLSPLKWYLIAELEAVAEWRERKIAELKEGT